MWNVFLQPNFSTITFVFMMSQRSSNKKHINMWYKIASGASNQRAKFVRLTLQMNDFAPITRWCHELQKGILLCWKTHWHCRPHLLQFICQLVDFILFLTSGIPYRGFSFWLILYYIGIQSYSFQSYMHCTFLC